MVAVLCLYSMGEKNVSGRQMNDRQLTFAVWFATPVPLRKPKTFDEVAEVLQVSRQTVWRWSKDPRVLDAARYVVLQNAGDPDKVTEVLDMIRSVAMENRDVKYAELWLKAVGVMGAQTRADLAIWDQVQEDSLDRLSDDALAALKAAQEAAELEQAAVSKAKSALASQRAEVASEETV